ncbi:MAG TPA: hypothetical protein VKG25_08395 [Bryobacteraceae bacterium]|nr:hypothetical protein [Bryobacteraceae bacterium]
MESIRYYAEGDTAGSSPHSFANNDRSGVPLALGKSVARTRLMLRAEELSRS